LKIMISAVESEEEEGHFLAAEKAIKVLIGLCGYAACGKDTAAQVLIEEFFFQRVAFAEPIKQALLALDPWVPDSTGGEYLRLSEFSESRDWAEVKEYPEVRRLMQIMGTEVGRNLFDPDIWVKLAEAKLASTLSVGHTVVTDVRFPNEARLIKRHGGALIRIIRPGFGPVNEHVSDRASESWTYDHHLENEGTIEELHQQMRALVAQLQQTQHG
jgi:Deoxynucleotide monophosphate kinase